MIDLVKQALEALLARALNGDLSKEEANRFQAMLDKRSEPKVLALAHSIGHFIEDLDIRQADAEYDRLQRESLKSQLRSLSES